jgi:four helix bundle protein
MQDFRNLEVWRLAHDLALNIYRATKSFPDDEGFGLSSQLRRSTSSIGANLAEGCGRESDTDFSRHGQIAMGSACEVDYQLLLARDLGYIVDAEYVDLQKSMGSIKRMLTSLLKTLRPTSGRQPIAESRQPK